ncbi:hypothetical protein ABUE31_00430 [Mesorhizobium sp. ZMM04-5]|uniref:Uncharacterized protein n=1 Tax=Mesorhizobium marinum TaxID=3228790 RepID=A0ABV3QU77_9HYPH
MIKFVAAAIWLCAVAIGAVFYSFQNAEAKLDAPAPLPLMGGLDSIKTDIVSVPVVRDGRIDGYFLARLVYAIESQKLAKLSVPPEALIVDQVYSYVYGNPDLDFSDRETLDLDVFRAGVRDKINEKVGDELIHEVLVEQVDFLSKEEIRDNTIRRRLQAGQTAREMAKGFKEH